MHPLRSTVIVAAALSVLAACGCALRQVNSFAERGLDPSRYHTFGWAAAAAQSTGDPRIDGNAIFHHLMQARVDAELTTRGYQKTTAETADLVVQYYAHVTQRVDLVGADLVYRACTDCTPYVYDAGSLTIDIVDGRTRVLLWRGWAEGDIGHIIDNQLALDHQVGRAVARILERLPRGL